MKFQTMNILAAAVTVSFVSGCSMFQDPRGSKIYLEQYDRPAASAVQAPGAESVVVSEVVQEADPGVETYAYEEIVTVPQVLPQAVSATGYSEGEAMPAAEMPVEVAAYATEPVADMPVEGVVVPETENPMADIVEVPASFVQMDRAPAGYYLQAAAFSSRDNATRFAKTMQEARISPVVIVEDDSTGNTLYKPQVGPFATVQEALGAESTLQTLGVSKPGLLKR